MTEPDRDAEALGARIRRLRLAMNLKQAALAARAGLTRPALSMLETGARGHRPCAATIARLADALGVPAAELMDAKR